MIVDALLAKLEKVKSTGSGTWLACCPAHEDTTPSLTIRETENGMVLLHCFASCSVADVLEAVGMEFGDLYPPDPADRSPPLRRPFPAADVLEALAHESLTALVCFADAQAGKPLNRERLAMAAERIQRGRELALGKR